MNDRVSDYDGRSSRHPGGWHKCLAVLLLVAAGWGSGCTHTATAFAPSARMAKGGPPAVPAEGANEIRAHGGPSTADAGGRYHGSLQYRRGVTSEIAVSGEAGMMDGSPRGAGFRSFYGARGGVKYAPEELGGHLSFEGGMGGVVGDGFETAFVSWDGGLHLGFDNDYVIPWLHAYGFFSQPILHHQTQWTSGDCNGEPCVHKLRTRRTAGTGAAMGASVPIGRMGPNTIPVRLTVQAGMEQMFPLGVGRIREQAAPATEWEGVLRLMASAGLTLTL